MRRFSPVLVIAVLVFLAGCRPVGKVPFHETDWEVVRWADASCLGLVEAKSHYHDMNADGVEEAFLVMHCRDKTDPRGDLVEIITGGTDVASTRPSKLLLQQKLADVDRVCFIGPTVVYRVTIAGHSENRQVQWWKGAPGKPKPYHNGTCP
jgi:hypothetical protein